jgi:hypothetical protein
MFAITELAITEQNNNSFINKMIAYAFRDVHYRQQGK